MQLSTHIIEIKLSIGLGQWLKNSFSRKEPVPKTKYPKREAFRKVNDASNNSKLI